MKTLLAGALATLVTAGVSASISAGDPPPADGLRIESEAQFARDYDGQVEKIGPGVYLIVAGALSGKTVTIGEAGLAYDIRLQRQRLAEGGAARDKTRALIRQMEGIRARYGELRAQRATDAAAKRIGAGTFPCRYGFGANAVWYTGFANVQATTELYMDNGGGGLNWYYARASAVASGYASPPHSVPPSISVAASARAENRLNGQVVQFSTSGFYGSSASTGYVYSGPEFSHNLFAAATVSGLGNCWGYVSISDTMQ